MKIYSERFVFGFIILIMLQSCMSRNNEIKKYLNFIYDKKNGLVKEKKVGQCNFVLCYEPVNLVTLRELNKNDFTRKEFFKTKSQFDGMVYFNFKFSYDSLNKIFPNDSTTLSKVLNHLTFHIDEDIYLVTESHDTLPCLLSHCELSDKTGIQSVKASLAFDRPGKWSEEIEESLEFVYRDQVLGGEPIIIKFPKAQFISIPALNSWL